jgi:hypothetical protein
MSLAENLQDIYQRLMITADDVDMSVDEIYAYAKKFKLNRDSLYSFIKSKVTYSPATTKMENKKPSFEDYMEILKAKRASSASNNEATGTNYADGTVFYKGKALGRCPSGTTRSGKTCVPGAAAAPVAPGYKTPDLGGLSQAQVQALSKARSTEDIIKAHKKSNKQ